MAAVRDFEVSTRKREVVASALPALHDHLLPLSNLDLLLPPVDVGVFFCYKRHGGFPAAAARVGILKKALAETLVSYYAFSGEVVSNSFGEPEILCNNRGVEFVEAFADVELRQLNLYNPDESVEGKLVPKKKQGVLAVQATELKCGGIVVSCTFDHRIADAYSTNLFLVSWAETACSQSPLTNLPSFQRSLFKPRRLSHIPSSLNDMYVPVTSLPSPPPKTGCSDHEDPLVSRIYTITYEQLLKLQALASSNDSKRSKLESFCALLWKMVAASEARNDVEKSCKMGIVVDGRSRLANKNDLMASYIGNVLSIPFGGKTIKSLNDEPLDWIADEVHEFLKHAVTKEHFLGLIDWVEAHRPVPGLAKIYCSGSKEGPAFVVSSGQRFPISKVDFGWGKPIFGSYHFPWGGNAGYVMPMPSPMGNGDWVVYMHMSKKKLEVIEEEAGHVFKPFTFNDFN